MLNNNNNNSKSSAPYDFSLMEYSLFAATDDLLPIKKTENLNDSIHKQFHIINSEDDNNNQQSSQLKNKPDRQTSLITINDDNDSSYYRSLSYQTTGSLNSNNSYANGSSKLDNVNHKLSSLWNNVKYGEVLKLFLFFNFQF
jgi:hypothetical protein